MVYAVKVRDFTKMACVCSLSDRVVDSLALLAAPRPVHNMTPVSDCCVRLVRVYRLILVFFIGLGLLSRLDCPARTATLTAREVNVIVCISVQLQTYSHDSTYM